MTTSTPPQRKTYPALTSLRGLGAVWVVLFHVMPETSWHILNVGYLGVDLFFILSGFIISHVHAHEFASYSLPNHIKFLQLRLARIYPLHLTILCAFGLFVFFTSDFVERYPDPERLNLQNFIMSLLLIQNWGFGPWTLWNSPTWSLSAEWLAYLCFPILSIACKKSIPPRFTLYAALASLTAMIFALMLAGYSDFNGLGKAGVIRMLGGFLAGCFVFRFINETDYSQKIFSYLYCGCLLLGLTTPSLLAFSFYGFCFLIIALVKDESRLVNSVLQRPALVFLGEISFSIYLSHWPIIQIRNWAIDKQYILSQYSDFWVIIITLIISILLWKFIEVPSRKAGRAWANRIKAVT